MPTRDAGHIQWFIGPSSFLTVAAQMAWIKLRRFLSIRKYVSDEEQFGETDYWQVPEQFERTKKGNCEDYASVGMETASPDELPRKICDGCGTEVEWRLGTVNGCAISIPLRILARIVHNPFTKSLSVQLPVRAGPE